MINKVYESIKKFIKENYKGLIAIVVIYLVFTIELPYSIYTPGGAIDLSDRVEVEDGYEADGSFNMAYVSMVKGSIPFLLISKIIPDWDIVKKSDLTYDDEEYSDLLVREKLYLEQSVDTATINAYQAAGASITITKTNNIVSYITSDADTDLKVGDYILGVDGTTIEDFTELKEIIASKSEGDTVTLSILRNDKEMEATATVYEDDGLKIGISILNTYEYKTDPEIEVSTKSTEGGSSGGLMMSLAIYNELVSDDITKGLKIVGTGTIDIDGNVGEIGGVKYKLIGAVKNDADIFICPEENYEEALSVADEKGYDITIISVSTFEEALEKLANL